MKKSHNSHDLVDITCHGHIILFNFVIFGMILSERNFYFYDFVVMTL